MKHAPWREVERVTWSRRASPRWKTASSSPTYGPPWSQNPPEPISC